MTCPFCKTELPEGATVCAGCGAVKKIRGQTNGMLGRFMLWCNTIGVLLIVWGIAWYELLINKRSAFPAWQLVIVCLAGFPIYRLARRIWFAIFGRLTDEVWVR